MSPSVSAPSRSLGRRRRLIKNRFTIDTDEASTGSPDKEPEHQPPASSGGDTDRWVEEQFDLAQYEEQDHIKETDILSSDDEYCESVRCGSAEKDLQEQFQAASINRIPLGQSETYRKTMDAHTSRMAQLKKQSALSGRNGSTESGNEEVIWVKRDDFMPSRALNTEI